MGGWGLVIAAIGSIDYNPRECVNNSRKVGYNIKVPYLCRSYLGGIQDNRAGDETEDHNEGHHLRRPHLIEDH